MRLLGRLLLGLVLLIAVVVASVYVVSSWRFSRKYQVASRSLVIPTDSAAIERGRRLASTIGKCVDCHTEDLGGQPFIDDKAMGQIATANLTGGRGSRVIGWSPDTWDKAIRHGVGANDEALIIMPVHSYQYFTNEDVAALIAYLTSLPKVDREFPARSIGPVARGLYVAGKLPVFEAEMVNHDSVGLYPPMSTGEYIARTGGCYSCHGPQLAGGAIPGTEPGTPPAANISSTGMINWTLADFTRALRTGQRPDGSTLKPPMPWKLTAGMTDAEIEALWTYLRSTPPPTPATPS